MKQRINQFQKIIRMVFKDKEEDNLEDFKKGFVCYIFKDYI